ncbi:Sulfotransferase family cytosolic 2B member 1, partial [Phaethon lepturus]
FSKMCNSYEYPMSFEQLLKDFLNGELPRGSWFEYVQGCMEMKDMENFITYEELKQVDTYADPPAPNMLVCHKPFSGNRLRLSLHDLPGSVRHLCQFLGQDLDDEAVSSVVQNASFTAMQENPMCSSILLPADITDQTKGQFLRKGICGDWENHFTVAQSETFGRIYRDRMQGLNMTFPWDRHWDLSLS